MAYRRTDNVIRRLNARHHSIVRAARDTAAAGGMAAVQIAPVAMRAGIAAGTVYRYFPGKADLVAALVDSIADEELAAIRQAASAAPGPLSALAAAIATFAARALREPRLAWASIGEPVDPDLAAVRLGYRKALAAEFATLIKAAVAGHHLADLDPERAAAAVLGALIEAAAGPLAPETADPAALREAAQSLTLFALRGLGVIDARARGLVVQAAIPEPELA